MIYIDTENKKQYLESLNDSEWFNEICELFTEKNNVQLLDFMKLFGKTDDSILRERRGSKFLVPFDKRFAAVCVNPDLVDETINLPLEFASFRGIEFCLKKSLVLDKFKTYQIVGDYRTESTKLSFENIPTGYTFTKITLSIDIEIYDFKHDEDYIFHNLQFYFKTN